MSDTATVSALLTLAESIIEAVKESGLLRQKSRRRARGTRSKNGRSEGAERMRKYREKKAKAAAAKARNRRVASEHVPGKGKKSPLANVPDTAEAPTGTES